MQAEGRVVGPVVPSKRRRRQTRPNARRGGRSVVVMRSQRQVDPAFAGKLSAPRPAAAAYRVHPRLRGAIPAIEAVPSSRSGTSTPSPGQPSHRFLAWACHPVHPGGIVIFAPIPVASPPGVAMLPAPFSRVLQGMTCTDGDDTRLSGPQRTETAVRRRSPSGRQWRPFTS